MTNANVRELVLITYEFPFGKGETFLESEVEYLAKGFHKVWVVPARIVWSPHVLRTGQLAQRKLPENFNIPLFMKPKRFSINSLLCCIAIRKMAVLDTASKTPRCIREKISWREALKAGILSVVLNKFIIKNGSIYAYSYWKNESATALAFLKRKKLLTGFVTRCHGGDLYDEVLPYPFSPYRPLIAQEADFIIPVSKDGVDYLLRKGVHPHKLALQRLGVKRAEKITAPSADGILRILSCSNLIPVKRINLIAESLVKLKRPFQWMHFGDGIERNQIEKIVNQIPSHGQVLLPGRVPNRDVLKHYTNFPVDVFINVSVSEGVPVSIMEALAHGVPCFATDVGGSGELIDETCGMLLDYRITPESLALELARIIPESSHWLHKRQGALMRWEERACAEKNYTDFTRFLTHVIESH